MQVSVLQENLNQGLNVVSKIISSRTTLPILNNILFTALEGKLKLTTTNLEISINYWLPAKKEKEGKFTVPAKDLTEFISSLKADKLDLEVNKEKLLLKSEVNKASFNGMEASDYPVIPSLKDNSGLVEIDQKIILPANQFIQDIKQVVFSASIDESRPILTGVRMSIGEKMEMVATDGFRLSLKTTKLTKKIKNTILIIPAKALLEVIRIAQSYQKNSQEIVLAVTKDKSQIIFSFDEVEIVARLLEGEFPNFEKIIPHYETKGIIIDKEEFFQGVKTSAIFSRHSANILKFDFSSNKLIIKANASEFGENEINLNIDYQGDPIEIAFNHRFLLDFLNNLEEDQFVLKMENSLKPGLFEPKSRNGYLHIVMPVRTQKEE